MDSRRLLSYRVKVEGWSVSSAARAAGVSRPTAYLWIERSGTEGLSTMSEHSRRPLVSPRSSAPDLVSELLALKARYPLMGPKKLSALMQGRLSERTSARILARHGLTGCLAARPADDVVRFEREFPNELWQMDFKGLRRRPPRYEILSVLDDSTRRLLCLKAMPNQQLSTFWPCLWEAFGEYGLPEAIITDNGASFRIFGTWRLSRFDVNLIKLGVRSSHGRPYHPQTQGKVERFHGSLARDVGEDLYQESIPAVQGVLDRYRAYYDWIRPHEAIGQRPPATLYSHSPRPRPDRMPQVEYEPGKTLRHVCPSGFITFKGTRYCVGKGLHGEYVAIDRREQDGEFAILFGTYYLGLLRELAERNV